MYSFFFFFCLMTGYFVNFVFVMNYIAALEMYTHTRINTKQWKLLKKKKKNAQAYCTQTWWSRGVLSLTTVAIDERLENDYKIRFRTIYPGRPTWCAFVVRDTYNYYVQNGYRTWTFRGIVDDVTGPLPVKRLWTTTFEILARAPKLYVRTHCRRVGTWNVRRKKKKLIHPRFYSLRKVMNI